MLELAEFQKSLVPLARQAIQAGLGYRDVADVFMQTLVTVAVEDSKGNQSMAARRLGVSAPFVNAVIQGKTLARRRKHPVKEG
jgi:hypothetical protein